MRIMAKVLATALSSFVVCLTMSPFGLARDTGKDKPPDRFVDRGACPFECCTYRQWTTSDAVHLLDRPSGRHVVGSLRKGEPVQGLTGEVISTPVAVKADREIPETPIKANDTFYVLHYDGEGLWKVWFHGKTTFVDESNIKVPPRAEWWVKVKKTDGVIGWTLSDKHFLHQDACE